MKKAKSGIAALLLMLCALFFTYSCELVLPQVTPDAGQGDSTPITPENPETDFDPNNVTIATAYEKAQSLGFTGTLSEFIELISGKDGVNGADGTNGKDGADGVGIQSITVNSDGHLIVTLTAGDPIDCGKIIGDSGANGKDGVGIKNVYVDDNGQLMVSLSNGTKINCGTVIGTDGTDGKDGLSIKSAEIDSNGELILTLSDDSTINAGKVVGADGEDGIGIASVKLSAEGNLIITLSNNTVLDLGCIKGADGKDGADGKNGIDGKDVSSGEINADGELVFTLSDGSEVNVGKVIGENGKNGIDGIGIKAIAFNASGELIITLSDGNAVNCGKIPVCDHSYSAMTTIQNPTCGSMGVKVAVCSKCGFEKYEFTSPAGHTHASVTVAPTCTDAGYTEHTCSTCGYTYRDSFTEKKAHAFGDYGSIMTTCTQRLSMRVCSVCSFAEIKSEAYDGHVTVTVEAKAASCTEAGWSEYVKCRYCDYSTYSEIAATGHDTVSHEAVAPTCTEIGWNAYEVCSVCGYSTYSELPAKGHHIVVEAAVPPTDTEYGYTRGEHCYYCDYVLLEPKPIYPTGYDVAENYYDDYGYTYLGTMENGEAMQKLYTQIDTACDAFHISYANLSSTEVATVDFSALGLSTDEALAVYSTYKNDNPLYWWISTAVQCTDTHLTVLTDEEYLTGARRGELNELIYSGVEEYISGITPERTAYDIALYFHDTIITSIDYAYESDGATPEDALWAHSVLGVFDNRSGVCEAYARAFQLLLNYCDVENVFVTGEASGEKHAWNLAKMDDGEWYWFDLTWDDAPNWMWGIKYNYLCVNDTENTLWSDGGWEYSYTLNFLDEHVAGTPEVVGNAGYFLYELPSRSTVEYTDDSSLILRDTFQLDGFSYAVAGADAVQATGLPEGDVIIPETVTYNGITYTVISLGTINDAGLLGTSLMYTGDRICKETISVIIPKTVKFIWDGALEYTKMVEIIVDDENPYFASVDGVLFTKNLYTLIQYPNANPRTEYAIPDETVFIAYQAFSSGFETSNLEVLTIGKSLKRFGLANQGKGYPHGPRKVIGHVVLEQEFYTIRSMRSSGKFSIHEENEYYHTDGTFLYLSYLGDEILCGIDKSITTVVIPDGVTTIKSEFFEGYRQITTVVIPSSVTSIDYRAFANCTSLTSITIPDSVTSIGSQAFSDCTGLTSITIPDSVTSIGSAFSGCTGLTSITIPDSVTSIGSHAFSGCTGLTSITIPDSVTSIGRSAFYNCTGLTSITIPDSVTSIGSHAFYGCTGLTSITIPDSVTSIGGTAFYGCSHLTSISIPDSVTSIGDWAFRDCTSLTSITIPDSVTSIGDWAFRDCTSLTSITIPDSVTSIGNYAFYGCSGLTGITIPDSITSIGDYAFERCSRLTIYCEAESQPEGWVSSWNYSNCPVVWGYTGEE